MHAHRRVTRDTSVHSKLSPLSKHYNHHQICKAKPSMSERGAIMQSNGDAGPSSPSTSGKRASCRHLEISSENLKRYAAGLRWGRKVRRGEVRKDEDGEEDQYDNKRRKLLAYPSCAICKASLHRPFMCLECALPACFLNHVEYSSDCQRQHLRKSGHNIAFDIFDGTLYCSSCEDVVYDDKFEAIASKEVNRSVLRRRVDRSKAQNTGGENATTLCKAARGMYNLGATCFMNVILQAFLHNPLLRNYFLSDRHNTALCPARENCLACELDTLFMEFFSTSTRAAPFAPTNFLFCIYLARESTELSSGAGEHDAHELFIASLNGVHSALMAVGREPSSRSDRLPLYPYGDQAHGLAASRSGSASNASEEEYGNGATFRFTSDIVCPCVVHRTFSGVLQSDVTCQRCGWTSTTHDPFLDLSLDIRSNHARSLSIPLFETELEKKKSKKQKDREEKERKDRLQREGSGLDDEQTLVDCMRRYCAMEKLAQSDYSCAQCGVPSQAVKQLSICRLPPVMCIQLKRFEHNTTTGSKIENRVRFPLTFDMSEFCTSTMREDLEQKGDPEIHLYDLFTVVVHEGKLNTGHYYCYFKWRDQWYIANDDNVHPAKLQDVLSCKAYQLCYKRRMLQNVRQGL